MRRITVLTGGRPAPANDRRAIDAAVARCVMPIGDEEARAWDEIVAQRARAA